MSEIIAFKPKRKPVKNEVFIQKLYDTLVYEQVSNNQWITPEYKDNLHKFVDYCAEEKLGKDIADLVYDVALGQCSNGTINGKQYKLDNLEDLLVFIGDYNNEIR